MLAKVKILINGAGDRGTTAALRLFRCGFRPVLIERKQPGDLYSYRNFSDVVYLGNKTIDSITCSLITYTGHGDDGLWHEIDHIRADRKIPLISVDNVEEIKNFGHRIIIDCAENAHSPETFDWSAYPCVIRIGSEFIVGRDGHFVIGEAGDELGRAYRMPQELHCKIIENQHLTTSPLDGLFIAQKEIGDEIKEKDIIGTLDAINILAPRYGEISGILHSGHFVTHGQPLFEIGPARTIPDAENRLPVECWAMAGGILEAILTFLSENGFSD